jgi:amino acid adenylation domain-containing protein
VVLNGRVVPLPATLAVHEIVAEQARSHPGRVAVTCGPDQYWTFAQLEARANQFAHHLRGRGVARSSVVGVCLDRTLNLMVAILGILKTGAAYLPLDPTYPYERLQVMTAQVPRMSLVVVEPATRDLITDVERCDLSGLSARLDELPETPPATEIDGSDLCYVVCTSGSTGTPKAVAVTHRGWFNLLSWLRDEYLLGTDASGLVISPFGFDLTQRALMLPLFVGATLHLLPSRRFDPLLAYRLIESLAPATMHCAPSAFYLLAERDALVAGGPLRTLGHVFLGGEPPSASRIADWATAPGNEVSIVNVYGVAECTDISAAHILVDYDAYTVGSVPAGEPVHNTQILILDDELVEVEAGETGEIAIAGAGVSPGYLDTAPAYQDRFSTVEVDGTPTRVHRTGDRGYLSPSGELMVVGRTDAQVKVRGMRIDLGDVEIAIRRLPQVRDAAVVALPRGDETELVAAVLAASEPLEFRVLRGHLSRTLPQGMIPRDFVEIAEFPLSPNGKIDRTALARQLRSDSRFRM